MSCQNEDQNSKHTCKCKFTACSQTLDDMEFERGIWSAAQNGDNCRVKKLAVHGVDKVDQAGYTALHHAARAGHYDTCKLLLSLGASVDSRTRSGMATALHRSASAGRLKIVKALVDAGADVNLKDSDGQTALHRAAAAGHAEIAEYILSVDPKSKIECDNRGRLPIQLAQGSKSNDNENFIRLLT